MATALDTNRDAPLADRMPDPYGYGEDFYNDQFEIGAFIRRLLVAISRNFWLILVIVGLVTALALVVTLLQTPHYTAEASLEINEETEQVLGEEFDTQTGAVDSWDTDRFLNTQLQILTSRSIAERVANRLNLAEDPAFFAAMQAPSPDEYASVEERQRDVVSMLIDNLDVDLPVDSRVVALSFTSIDPELSAEVVNTYSEEFIQASLQRRFDSSSYARDFVQSQLAAAREQLEASERELNDYARQAGLIRTRDASADGDSDTSSIMSQSLSQINAAANEAQAARIAAEARYRAEAAQPLLSSPAAMRNPTFQLLRSRIDELRYEYQGAQDRYGPEHPTVQRLASEVETVEQQLLQLAREARQSVRAEYEAARDAQVRLTAEVNNLQGASLAEQDRSVRYNTLAREADTARQIYEGLLQRYRELNASAGITASNIAIVDAANPPQYPSFPNPILNGAVGLLLGMFIAGGVVFLRSQLDDRIITPDDLAEKAGLTLLGVVPKSKEDVHVEILDPKTAISEAYGAVRASLMFATPHGLPRTLMVTSVRASEGKSTTAFAVAAGIAKIGKRTLLIDADLRRPTLHQICEIDNDHGLASLLVGNSTLQQSIRPGGEPNFYVMTSGGRPPNPAELLSTGKLADFLSQLLQQYDCIMIDSPPVLGLADTPMLAGLVEAVVLVVEAEQGRAGQIKPALRRLRQSRANIVGSVLTKFDPDRPGNEQASYYGYDYYQYGKDED